MLEYNLLHVKNVLRQKFKKSHICMCLHEGFREITPVTFTYFTQRPYDKFLFTFPSGKLIKEFVCVLGA